MKLLCLFSLVVGPLFGQLEIDKLYTIDLGDAVIPAGFVSNQLSYKITRTGPFSKNIQFVIDNCLYPTLFYDPASLGLILPFAKCVDFRQSVAQDLYGSEVDAKIAEFKSNYPRATTKTISYGPFFRPHPADALNVHATLPLPTSQPNPYVLYLDGLSYNFLKVDLSTFAILSKVVVPSTTGPFGVRPNLNGDDNEVWVVGAKGLGGGLGITVVDMGVGAVLADILTPGVPPLNNLPAGIVFTNSGATAFEAVNYATPDASGNQGALLVFDAANRKLTSTLPLKFAPSALIMAPDGLTVYVLYQQGQITYYDVVSGTADLTVSTYTPGKTGGYSFAGQAFVHPDGTRLFWNVGAELQVFDLTTRKVTNQFNSGLPSTSATTMTMSQDGSKVFISNGAGDVVFVETRFGNVLAKFQVPLPGALVFGGAAIN